MQTNWMRIRAIKQLVTMLVCFALTIFLEDKVSAHSLTFNFTIPTTSTTSAGAYKTDGTLVRTLWSGVKYNAGTYSYLWDGNDDSGLPVAAGNYQVKVLTHKYPERIKLNHFTLNLVELNSFGVLNVNYVWEGVLGNTSTNMTGYSMYQGMEGIRNMTFAGSKGYYAIGYTERNYGMYSFNTSNPQLPTPYLHTVSGARFNNVATDGTYVYYTVDVSFNNLGSGVLAWNIATGSEVNFGANGTTLGTSGGETYFASLINRDTTNSVVPTGMAVQNTGSYLFVSHGAANQIRQLDKTSGAAITSIAVTNPGSIVATTDDHLWVICTNASSQRVVRKYAVVSGGGLTQVGEITGLSNPLSVAVSPDNATVIVADGGSSQQVKAFSTSGAFSSSWTYGQAGGYLTNGPAVTNDKLWFRADRGFVAFQPDGSFWVFDSSCYRYLHLSASRDYIDHIQYLPQNYMATVDQNDPTRVFGEGWLEFQVDYSQPIQSSWTLVNNWSAGVPAAYLHAPSGTNEGMGTVVTLSNGRTYAMVNKYSVNKNAVMELTSSGMRATGTELVRSTTLNTDGSLRTVATSGGVATYAKQTLNSFDVSHNPIWNASASIASVSYVAGSDPVSSTMLSSAGVRVPVTSSNVVASFNNRKEDRGWHWGGINPATNQWLWKASPTGYLDGLGTFDPNVNYGGNTHFSSGKNIIYGFHGEGYLGGQANQWMHFYDNGLFVGQFGTPLYPYNSTLAGQSGNAFNWALITAANGNTYTYNGTEGVGGGIHRWRVDGLSSIAEQTVNLTLTSAGNGTGLTGQYFTNQTLSSLAFTRNDETVDFNWGASDPDSALPTDSFSIRWAGAIVPLYSETYTFSVNADDGVRLWIDGQPIINDWVNGSATRTGTIALQAGRRYSIALEYFDNTGSANAALSWSSASQTSQIVPTSQLYPLNQVALNSGLANLPVGNFSVDAFYSTSTTFRTNYVSGTIDRTARNAGPELLYQSGRGVTAGIGQTLTYTIANLAPSSTAIVRLHFMEDYWNVPNNRKGNIAINGTNVLTNFDVRNEAGAKNKVLIKQFPILVNAAGQIVVTITNGSGSPFHIRGLEVLGQYVYEAENGTLAGGAAVAADSFASNSQVVGTMTGTGASLTLNNVVCGAGRSVGLRIRYACASAGTKSLYINGVKIAQYNFPSTGATSGSGAYAELYVPVALNPGTNNTIALKNDAADSGDINFDKLTIN